MRTYQIQSNDTLSKIAQRHGTTADALAQTNRISNPDLINTGRMLVIPDGWDRAARPTSSERLGSPAGTASASLATGGGFSARQAEELARSWAPAELSEPSGAGESGQIESTEQANPFHVTQWGPTPYNSGGTEYGFSDCVPTSGVIALSRLGLIQPPGADGASAAIDGLRDASYGYDTTQSNPMDYGTISNGLAQYGAMTTFLDYNDLSSIDAALERGNPVMAAGNPWNAWGAAEDAKGNYLNHRDPGGHSTTILGKTKDGNYIVADPLLSQSTIEVTPDQLRQFFADGGGNSGAMEVSRADGQSAPGVPGGELEPKPEPTKPGGTAPATPPQVELERGMESPEVEQLQQTLVDLGFMTPEEMATSPGTYGPRTEQAVSELQDYLIQQGLMTAEQKATGAGSYGPVTRGALNTYLANGTETKPTEPGNGTSGTENAQFKHLDGINPPADNESARTYWAQYVKDEVMPRLQELGVDPELVKDAAWFGLSEGIYTVANNPGYGQANGTQSQSPISFSNFADSSNWPSNNINGQTAFPPGLPYGDFGWRSGNWQVGIAGAQVTDAVDSGSLVKAYKMLYGDTPPEALGQKMLGIIGEGQRDFPNLSIEQLATQENQQWAAVLLRDPMINVLVQTMNPAITGPFGYGREIVDQVFG